MSIPILSFRAARELDKAPEKKPLHGLPVGFKDIIATADMPTTFNSALYADQMIGRDASCVAIVRHSGGLIFGKTDTVEFASGGRTALTRNPANLNHTPGGSSSGSPAAVADLQAPLAFGTQTGGSVIRPAAFCGVYAIKPTFGLASYEGVKNVAPMLDTIGWYGRSVADLQLVGKAFRLPGIGDDAEVSPKELKVGFCRTPMWEKSEEAARRAFDVARKRLTDAGCAVFDLDLPSPFERLQDAASCISNSEKRSIFLPETLAFGQRLARSFHDMVEADFPEPHVLGEAYDLASACRTAFDAMFRDGRLDVVVAPAAPGEAPEGLESTGDAIFNTMWTLLHVPCVAIPVGSSASRSSLGNSACRASLRGCTTFADRQGAGSGDQLERFDVDKSIATKPRRA